MRRKTLAAAVGALLVTGCSTAQTSTDATYTFRTSDTSIRVDSPDLRQAKRRAGIQDCPTTARSADVVDQGLASITLPCFGGGRTVDMSQLRGTPTVVNLWAQYCGPCREEMPLLQEVATQARGRVRFLGVDYTDAQPGMAMQLLRETGVTYPQMADPTGALSRTIPVQGLPVTFFVKPDGTVSAVGAGAFTSADQLRDHIRTNLGVDLRGAR